jgi:hypothetical protein
VAVYKWVGGAAATAQIDTLTPASVAATDVLRVTLTAEDGSTQQHVDTTMTGSTAAQACDDMIVQLQASTETLFRRLTFSDQTTHVQVTANTAGVPFYMTTSVTNTSGGGAPTLTRAASTVSSGPNDFNVLANWILADGAAPSGGEGVPGDADEIHCSTGNHDILYGLDQNTTDLKQFRVTGGYQGSIGQPTIPLHIDVSDVSGSVISIMSLGGRGRRYNLEGVVDNCIVTRCNGLMDLKLTTMDTLQVIGNAVGGRITLKNGSSWDSGGSASKRYRQVMADNANVKWESGVSNCQNVHIDGGYFETHSSVTSSNGNTLDMLRGTACFKSSAACGVGLNMYGGLFKYQSDQDLGNSGANVLVYGGTVDVSQNTKVGSCTVHNPTVFQGVLDASAEQDNVVFDGPSSEQVTVYFGEVRYSRAAGQTSGAAKGSSDRLA